MTITSKELDEFMAAIGTLACTDRLDAFPEAWRPAMSGLRWASLSPAGGFFYAGETADGMVVALIDQDGAGPWPFGWRAAALLRGADEVIVTSAEAAPDSLWHGATMARAGRLVLVIATTATQRGEWLNVVAELAPGARLAVLSGGDTAGWHRQGGTA